MLVLTRQRDEKIIATIPPSTEPTRAEFVITDIRGDKVRVGLVGPRNVAFDRDEVDRSKQRGLRKIV